MNNSEKRAIFFKLVFGDSSGYLCISNKGTNNVFREKFFKYPGELNAALVHIQDIQLYNNVWFCAQLMNKEQRVKSSSQNCKTLWSDLDECHPEKLQLQPSVILETSTGRFQALWVLEDEVDPLIAEDFSRRIAYHHQEDGADTSGWDLTQLLRVPYTNNYKYDTTPIVNITDITKTTYDISDFTIYPEVQKFKYLEQDVPDISVLKAPAKILETVKNDVSGLVWELFFKEPLNDWSASLWKLERSLFEAGLSAEDVFAVCKEAACNKYDRDDRSDTFLWKEVLRAENFGKQDEFNFTPDVVPFTLNLLTPEERQSVQDNPSIVEEYIEWAITTSDAAAQYHQGSAFIVLSAMLAGTIRLPTAFDEIIPNIWLMILADTTLTRKSTAMNLAMDMIREVDDNALLATDGSIEGIFSSLAARPNRVSIFHRDEVSGLLDSMMKKDYQAGMSEALTKLYDGKEDKRVLRKETINVRNPILISYMGGIRSRVIEILDYRAVYSGFLPRFIIIQATADISMLKPLGPPTTTNQTQKSSLIKKFNKLRNFYNTTVSLMIGDQEFVKKKIFYCELTSDAWVLYNRYEAIMLEKASESYLIEVTTPTMDRLAKTGLKMSMLLAATRMEEDIVVTEDDVRRAFYYIELWSKFTLDLLENLGKSYDEKTLERAIRMISTKPEGYPKSLLMRNLRLTAHSANSMIDTLEQRNIIRKRRSGSGVTLVLNQ